MCTSWRRPGIGDVSWSFAGDGNLSYPPVLAAGYVYAASDANVYALDPTTHQQVWTGTPGGWLSIANGQLYAASALTAWQMTQRAGRPSADVAAKVLRLAGGSRARRHWSIARQAAKLSAHAMDASWFWSAVVAPQIEAPSFSFAVVMASSFQIAACSGQSPSPLTQAPAS